MSEAAKAGLLLAALALVVAFVGWSALMDWLDRRRARAEAARPIILPRGRSSNYTGPAAESVRPNMSSELKTLDITCEEWREYEFGPADFRTTYRITAPVSFAFRDGGTTHRVVDSTGVVHCVPIPGREGCVLRWKSKDTMKPVAH